MYRMSKCFDAPREDIPDLNDERLDRINAMRRASGVEVCVGIDTRKGWSQVSEEEREAADKPRSPANRFTLDFMLLAPSTQLRQVC